MELLLRWLNEELNLSIRVVSLEEQCRNGYLFGEVFAAFNQQPDFHLFINKDSSAAKLRNYTLLEPVFRRLNVKFDAKTAFELSEGAPKVALSLLSKVRSALASYFSGRQPSEYTTILRPTRPQFDATMQKTFEDSLRMLLESDKEVDMKRVLKRFTMRGEQLQYAATISSHNSLRSAVEAVEYDIYRHREEKAWQQEAKAEWEASQYMQWKTNQLRARKRRQMHATFLTTQHSKMEARQRTQRQRDVQLVEQSLDEFDDKLAQTAYAGNLRVFDVLSAPTDFTAAGGIHTWGEAALDESYRNDVKTMRYQKQERTEREVTRERRRKRYLKTDEQCWAELLRVNLVKDMQVAANRLSRAEERQKADLSQLQQYQRVFDANRTHRQALYEEQKSKDLEQAARLDDRALEQEAVRCQECASMLLERQSVAAQAALSSAAERTRLLCSETLRDLIKVAVCAAEARLFIDGPGAAGKTTDDQIIPGFAHLWKDVKAAFVHGEPIDHVAAWLFNRAQSRETACAVSEKLKRRDADAALRAIAEQHTINDPSASYFVGETLIDLRCLARPLNPAASPPEILLSFKHRLAICGSPGHDSTAIATEVASKLNLFVISVHELIAECANLVIQDHEHLRPLPPPTNPIGELVAAAESLVAKTLRDLANLSANAALAPPRAKLQALCDNITGAATTISLDMKVAGAAAVQCTQDAEDINDALVVKLALLGIRAAGLQLQRNQLETERFELWRQTNELAITEWRNAVTAKRKEIDEARVQMEADPDLDEPEIAHALEELEAKVPPMPEIQQLPQPDATINGWIISDFPSTLAQAQLFVEKVSGFREDQPPGWRGDRSSQIFPAAPVKRPAHECSDPGVDMFIKLEQGDREFYVRTASMRSSRQRSGEDGHEQLSVLEVAPSSLASKQLLAGGLSCVAPVHSQLHMLPAQRQVLAQSSNMFDFLERLNRLTAVGYSSTAAHEVVEKLQHHEAEAEATSTSAPSEPTDDRLAGDEQPTSNNSVTNISVKAANAVVGRVQAFEHAFGESTETFADTLRHVNLGLYQREHDAKHLLRSYMLRAASFQEIWDRFCESFNEIEDDFRFDAQVAQELALRCELARKALWQSAEQRLEENLQLLKSVSEDGWREATVSKLDKVTAYMIQAEVNRFEVACGLVSDTYHLAKPPRAAEPLESSRTEAAQKYKVLLRQHWEQPLTPQAEPSVATSKKSGKAGAAAAGAKETELPLPRIETLSAVTGPDAAAPTTTEKTKQTSKEGKQPASARKGGAAGGGAGTAATLAKADPLSQLPQVAASMLVATNVVTPWTEEQFKLPEAEARHERVVVAHKAIWCEARRCRQRIEAYVETAKAMQQQIVARVDGYTLQLRAEIWVRHLAEASALEACMHIAEQCVLEHTPLPLDVRVDAAQASILPSRLLRPPAPSPIVAYDGRLEEHLASRPTAMVANVVQSTPSWRQVAGCDVEEISQTLHRSCVHSESLRHVEPDAWRPLVESAMGEKGLQLIP